MKYIFIILTILTTAYGQLIMKYEINKIGQIPTDSINSMLSYFVKSVSNIGIISGMLALVISTFTWMAAISKFDLSTAYPIMSINFILIPFLSVFLLNESFNFFKLAGVIVIIIGIIIFSKGM